MTTVNKLFGTLLCSIGLAFAYLEYVVVCAISSLGSWIAGMAGATGGAHTGVVFLSYIPVIGLMLLILGISIAALAFGIWFFRS